MEEPTVTVSTEPPVASSVPASSVRRPSHKLLIIVAVVLILVAVAVLSYAFYFKDMFEERARETHQSALEQLPINEEGLRSTETEKKKAVQALPNAEGEASLDEKQAMLGVLGR